jgi:dTDP-4-dehydrorhamnose 3,5-epimerase
MNIIKNSIEGLIIFEPKIFTDQRGYFFESFNSKDLSKYSTHAFVQDNESYSTKNVLRGLHFQTGYNAQGKLVRVVLGSVLDVVVDLRLDSKSFGQHYAIELSSENKRQIFVPRGFAHGFVVLSDDAILQYKCDNFYNKEAENGLRFDDPALNIDWKLDHNSLIVNERDRNFPNLEELKLQLKTNV